MTLFAQLICDIVLRSLDSVRWEDEKVISSTDSPAGCGKSIDATFTRNAR
jgi:hypothetical protein